MVTRVRVPLSNMGKIEKNMATTFKSKVEKAMKVAARQCIPVLSSRTWDSPPASDSPRSKGPPHASGTFLAGWTVEYDAPNMSVMIYNKAVHAGWVDRGVRASRAGRIGGASAVTAIEDWILQKGIQFNDPKGKSLGSRKMAWVIIGAINRRGAGDNGGWRFRPRNVAERSRPRIAEIFKKRIREAYSKAIEDAVMTKGLSLAKDV